MASQPTITVQVSYWSVLRAFAVWFVVALVLGGLIGYVVGRWSEV